MFGIDSSDQSPFNCRQSINFFGAHQEVWNAFFDVENPMGFGAFQLSFNNLIADQKGMDLKTMFNIIIMRNRPVRRGGGGNFLHPKCQNQKRLLVPSLNF